MEENFKKQLQFLEGYAKQNYVPIIRPETLKLLRELIKEQSPKNVLEIGTAIGYSSVIILDACSECFLTTVEINKIRTNIAAKVFENLRLENRVKLINQDAYVVLLDLLEKKEKFDFIFLDGPKGQYLKYFLILRKLLNDGGVIFCDNVNYNNYIVSETEPNKKFKTIAVNLKKFYNYITADESLDVRFFKTHDGAATIKIKK